MVAAGAAHLSMIGEPEAAVGVEDDVIRTVEALALEAVVKRGHRAGRQVDALDRTARFGVGGMAGEEQAPHLDPFDPAIVADIGGAIGSDREPVRSAAEFGDDRQAAVGRDPRQRPARDFDEQYRSVGHRHRPFGKAQAGRDDLRCAVAAHPPLTYPWAGPGALRKSAASKPSGAATSTIGSSRASNSMRSEERRVGKECVSKCRYRWSS